MMAAMGLGLVACSDNLDDGQGANGNASQEGTTYVALKLDFNNASSRAGEQPVDGDKDNTMYNDDIEGNEEKITDVRILVIDEYGNSEYNAVVSPNVTNNDVYVFQITPGNKTFYAVVNGHTLGFDSQLNNWEGGDLTLNGGASVLYEYNETLTAGKGFLMSSVEPVKAQIQDDIDEATVLAGTANNVNITVDRVVAKVTVQMKNDIDMSKQTATLKTLTCQIGNADNLVYDKDAEAGSEYVSAGTLVMAKNEGGVRKTNDYYSYKLNASTKEGFDQSKLLSGTDFPLYANNTVATNPAKFYCLENTHAEGEYLQSNTTFVRVKATMIPNTAVKLSYTAANSPTPESIEIESVETLPSDPETFYVITAAPDQSYKGSYVFESDLVELYGENGIASGDANTDEAKAAAVIEALGQNERGYAFTEPYKNGEGYYNIWVNDLKDSDETYLNKAPVFRNDWYNLTITGIKLPGDPNPEIDPEQPIHPDTNVGVLIEIRKWNQVKHDVDLQ